MHGWKIFQLSTQFSLRIILSFWVNVNKYFNKYLPCYKSINMFTSINMHLMIICFDWQTTNLSHCVSYFKIQNIIIFSFTRVEHMFPFDAQCSFTIIVKVCGSWSNWNSETFLKGWFIFGLEALVYTKCLSWCGYVRLGCKGIDFTDGETLGIWGYSACLAWTNQSKVF